MLKKLLAATAVTASLTAPAMAEGDPVYLIAQMAVSDFDAYLGDYGSVAIPAILENGGEILVGAPAVTSLEGDYGDTNWTVVVKFPNEDAAMGWYKSDVYQAVIPVRQELTNAETATMIMAPQFKFPE